MGRRLGRAPLPLAPLVAIGDAGGAPSAHCCPGTASPTQSNISRNAPPPAMAMPPEVDLRLPVLGLLSDGGVHTIAEVTGRMADRFGLGEEERAETYAVSGRPKFGMRVRHAVSQLRIAEYTDPENQLP